MTFSAFPGIFPILITRIALLGTGLFLTACGGGQESRLIDDPAASNDNSVMPAENQTPPPAIDPTGSDSGNNDPASGGADPTAAVSEEIRAFNGSWVTDCYRIDPAANVIFHVITRYVFFDGRFQLTELTFEDSQCSTPINNSEFADARLVIMGTATTERFLIDPVFGVEARVVELATVQIQANDESPVVFANPSRLNELMYRSENTLYIGDREQLDGGGQLIAIDWEFPFAYSGPARF